MREPVTLQTGKSRAVRPWSAPAAAMQDVYKEIGPRRRPARHRPHSGEPGRARN